MRGCSSLCALMLGVFMVMLPLHGVNGDSPYRVYTWKITYGDIYPLGVKQQVLYLTILPPFLVFVFCTCLSLVFLDKNVFF